MGSKCFPFLAVFLLGILFLLGVVGVVFNVQDVVNGEDETEGGPWPFNQRPAHAAFAIILSFFLISFGFGVLAVWRRERTFFYWAAFLLLGAFAGLTVFGIFCLRVSSTDLRGSLFNSLTKGHTKKDGLEWFYRAQYRRKCCGVDSYNDWNVLKMGLPLDSVPDSCCLIPRLNCGEGLLSLRDNSTNAEDDDAKSALNKTIYTRPCEPILSGIVRAKAEYLGTAMLLAGFVAFGVATFIYCGATELFCMGRSDDGDLGHMDDNSDPDPEDGSGADDNDNDASAAEGTEEEMPSNGNNTATKSNKGLGEGNYKSGSRGKVTFFQQNGEQSVINAANSPQNYRNGGTETSGGVKSSKKSRQRSKSKSKQRNKSGGFKSYGNPGAANNSSHSPQAKGSLLDKWKGQQGRKKSVPSRNSNNNNNINWSSNANNFVGKWDGNTGRAAPFCNRKPSKAVIAGGRGPLVGIHGAGGSKPGCADEVILRKKLEMLYEGLDKNVSTLSTTPNPSGSLMFPSFRNKSGAVPSSASRGNPSSTTPKTKPPGQGEKSIFPSLSHYSSLPLFQLGGKPPGGDNTTTWGWGCPPYNHQQQQRHAHRHAFIYASPSAVRTRWIASSGIAETLKNSGSKVAAEDVASKINTETLKSPGGSGNVEEVEPVLEKQEPPTVIHLPEPIKAKSDTEILIETPLDNSTCPGAQVHSSPVDNPINPGVSSDLEVDLGISNDSIKSTEVYASHGSTTVRSSTLATIQEESESLKSTPGSGNSPKEIPGSAEGGVTSPRSVSQSQETIVNFIPDDLAVNIGHIPFRDDLQKPHPPIPFLPRTDSKLRGSPRSRSGRASLSTSEHLVPLTSVETGEFIPTNQSLSMHNSFEKRVEPLDTFDLQLTSGCANDDNENNEQLSSIEEQNAKEQDWPLNKVGFGGSGLESLEVAAGGSSNELNILAKAKGQ